jgi:hypothetical protein
MFLKQCLFLFAELKSSRYVHEHAEQRPPLVVQCLKNIDCKKNSGMRHLNLNKVRLVAATLILVTATGALQTW